MTKATRALALSASAVVLVASAGAAALAPALAPDSWGLRGTAGDPAATVDAPVMTLDPVTTYATCAAAPRATMGPTAVVDPAAPPEQTEPHAARLAATFPREDGAAAPAELGDVTLQPAGQLRLAGGGASSSAVFVAPPVQGRSAVPAGATISTTPAGDLRGLIAHPCTPPQDVSWLVGGGTQVGESTALHLRNVGATPASVEVSAWGSLGALAAPTLERLTLAPDEEREILIEGAVAPDPALGLRVEVRGGAVSAWAQSLRLDGLVPAGLTDIPHVTAPGQDLLIPGVLSTAEDPSVLRILNPGGAAAEVQVVGVQPDGQRRSLLQTSVEAASVAEVPIMETDLHALALASTEPITAAVGARRTGQPSLLDPETPPVDIAWAGAVPPGSSWAWTLPQPGMPVRAVLLAAAPEGLTGAATLRLYRDGGEVEQQDVEFAAGAAPRVIIPEDVIAVQLISELPVAATMVLMAGAPDGELIDMLPGTPDPHADQALRVDLR